MPNHSATILWTRDGADFAARKYSRAHVWQFDGGAEVKASASPSIVPLPYSDASAVDPEEAFIASAASCHMLFFLDFSQAAGFVAESYTDAATGKLTKDADGVIWLSRIDLNPKVEWVGQGPDKAQMEDLHHRAHEACFIANSMRSEIVTNL